jgi:hypothetical protein
MPAIVGSYEWATHDHGIAQNGRKAQQKSLVAHLTDRNQGETRPISSHRTVRRKAHRLLGQKIDLRYPPRAFLLSFLGHAASGTKHYNEEQHEHSQPPVSMLQYVGTSRFWFESFQNWQSEFLAVGAVVVLSIWLREHGSPESKPVHSAHDDTGR